MREKQIEEFANSQVDCEFFNEDLYDGIVIGAKWSDEHPDSKRTYTKKQLMDMGFAFTTNGDIVVPDQSNEDLKKYLEYRKQKFIEKAKEWLQETLYIHTEIEEDRDFCEIMRTDWVTSDYDSVEDFINGFCKAMEE